MSKVSDRLEKKLALLNSSLKYAAQRLWTEKDARAIYPLYLEQMHMIVRSGVSLMKTAVESAKNLPSTDSTNQRLIDYLEKHIDEEKGHDLWLLDDYEATGNNPANLVAKIPSCQVACMAGAQYYWIIHHDPVMIMGHIAALEINHPPSGFADYLRKITGYSREAFRAIARHETLDIVHKKEILNLIDGLELTPKEEVAVGVSGLHTLQSGLEVLDAIRENFDNKTEQHQKVEFLLTH